ncbi:MAG: Txe/YoeB family addiction module toxin [bacterium]|nr:Txe/YoeB family addiction module toxin [bacterium]
MKKCFSDNAWDDYLFWQSHDRKILKRINALIKDIERGPFDALGKPEALKHNLRGYWSRRITEEHRLVYKVNGDTVYITQCRYHY